MKLKIQILKNVDNFELALKRYNEDPLIYAKPDMDVEYATFNILDEDIFSYFIRDTENGKDLQITTTNNNLVCEYSDEIVEKLDKVIDFKNDLFYKQLK